MASARTAMLPFIAVVSAVKDKALHSSRPLVMVALVLAKVVFKLFLSLLTQATLS